MITLRASPTSPYARKAVAMAIETGLIDRITILATNPWALDTDLPADNPLGKVPALITDDGLVLFDSPVICEYLDSLHDGPRLFPPAGVARWRALRQQALADGIIDAAVACRLDRQRPAERQDPAWQERQLRAITRACDGLEGEVGDLNGAALTIGTLAVACALGYLDLRFADENWRGSRPALATWYAGFAQRPSMVRTAPPP